MSYLRIKAKQKKVAPVAKAQQNSNPRPSIYALGARLDVHSKFVVDGLVAKHKYKG